MKLLACFPLARSSYYYQPRLGQRGRGASSQTRTQSGLMVANEQVVDWIRELLQHRTGGPAFYLLRLRKGDRLVEAEQTLDYQQEEGVSANETSPSTLAQKSNESGSALFRRSAQDGCRSAQRSLSRGRLRGLTSRCIG